MLLVGGGKEVDAIVGRQFRYVNDHPIHLDHKLHGSRWLHGRSSFVLFWIDENIIQMREPL